ncbi:hypothetical protein WKH56_08560 [Priestia sp. SB1]|uniref:hypothetical protein n=1 Tax=Priestia sp. SB1 TaxID=3132359 RepID=UPI00317018E3
MIKQLENEKVLVTHITFDSKNAGKEYVEDIIDVCLSYLQPYVTGVVLDSKELDAKYAGKPVTIEEFIEKEQYALSKHNAIDIDFKTVGSSIDIFISANQSTYEKSIFANEELLKSRYGIKNVTLDMVVKELEYNIEKKKLPFMFVIPETRHLIVNRFKRVSCNS